MKLDEVIQQPGTIERQAVNELMQRIHVALPGTVVSYNATRRTANIQPSIRQEGSTKPSALLKDVPVFFPGNMLFTVSKGDECLVIFADTCIDAWMQHGGPSNAMMKRWHDLSDGFALVGFYSVPNASGGVDVPAKLAELEERIAALEED